MFNKIYLINKLQPVQKQMFKIITLHLRIALIFTQLSIMEIDS